MKRGVKKVKTKRSRNFWLGIFVLGVCALVDSSAHAAAVPTITLTTTGWAVDMSGVESILNIVIPGGIAMYGVRKMIKTVNRT